MFGANNFVRCVGIVRMREGFCAHSFGGVSVWNTNYLSETDLFPFASHVAIECLENNGQLWFDEGLIDRWLIDNWLIDNWPRETSNGELDEVEESQLEQARQSHGETQAIQLLRRKAHHGRGAQRKSERGGTSYIHLGTRNKRGFKRQILSHNFASRNSEYFTAQYSRSGPAWRPFGRCRTGRGFSRNATGWWSWHCARAGSWGGGRCESISGPDTLTHIRLPPIRTVTQDQCLWHIIDHREEKLSRVKSRYHGEVEKYLVEKSIITRSGQVWRHTPGQLVAASTLRH